MRILTSCAFDLAAGETSGRLSIRTPPATITPPPTTARCNRRVRVRLGSSRSARCAATSSTSRIDSLRTNRNPFTAADRRTGLNLDNTFPDAFQPLLRSLGLTSSPLFRTGALISFLGVVAGRRHTGGRARAAAARPRRLGRARARSPRRLASAAGAGARGRRRRHVRRDRRLPDLGRLHLPAREPALVRAALPRARLPGGGSALAVWAAPWRTAFIRVALLAVLAWGSRA